MAERRMFSKRIVNSARFCKMPISSQALYFHLGLNADDDGVVEAYTVMNLAGCTEDDLRVLVAKGFVKVLNEDLVTYITDWNENNHLRPDRKIDSIYQDLLVSVIPDVQLIEKRPRADAKKGKEKGVDVQRTTNGQPMDGIGKDSIGEDSIGKDSIGECKKKMGHFVPPTLEEVQDRIIEMKYVHVSAERFISFYASKGWMVGKTKMVDWKQALAGWESRSKGEAKKEPDKKPLTTFHNFQQGHDDQYAEFMKMVEGGNG